MVDERFEYTKQKLAEGVSQRQIARDLQVDHATVSYWIKNGFSTGTRESTPKTLEEINNWCSSNPKHYAYILGSYLGDGYIAKQSRTYKLRIYNDIKYPSIIDDQIRALQVLFPDNKVSKLKRTKSNCIEVSVHSCDLPDMFPQHGAGKKHDRDVSLTDQQWNIVWNEPECFIKGLIDSDGCLTQHTQIKNGVTYSRLKYQFTNKSLDIVDMYLKIMAKLSISARPTQKKCGTFNIFTNKSCDVEKIDNLYKIAENKLKN